MKQLQPNVLIFSDAGPDIRWIGNEQGYAGKTNWSTIDTEHIVVGNADSEYLNTGDPDGKQWTVGLCDVSIRPGWFYHESEDNLVKTPQQLVDIYYKSVGRNGVLLLNIPPNKKDLLLPALKTEEKADSHVEGVLIMGIIKDNAVANFDPSSQV